MCVKLMRSKLTCFRLSVLDRYLLVQLAYSVGFGTLLFVILFISASLLFQTIKLILNYKVDLLTATKFFMLSLPQVLAYCLPMGTLLGVLLTFNRMSSDNEITALRTLGISFHRITLSVIVFSLILTGFNLWLYNILVPETQFQARSILSEAKRKLSGELVKGITFKFRLNSGMIRSVVAEYWDPGKMTMFKLTITDRLNSKVKRVILADKAHFDPNRGKWILQRVNTFEFEGDNLKAKFKAEESVLELGSPEMVNISRRPEEYTLPQLLDQISILRKIGSEPTTLEVELHTRLSIPLAVLVFAIFAVALGIQPIRSSSTTGTGLSLLMILIYYILFYLGKSLALSGKLPAWLGPWIADIVFTVTGFKLISNLNRS